MLGLHHEIFQPKISGIKTVFLGRISSLIAYRPHF